MAALGWLAGTLAGRYIARWDHWVAFGLLVDHRRQDDLSRRWRGDDDEVDARFDRRSTSGSRIATSIDAAAAGHHAAAGAVAPWLALVLIGTITAPARRSVTRRACARPPARARARDPRRAGPHRHRDQHIDPGRLTASLARAHARSSPRCPRFATGCKGKPQAQRPARRTPARRPWLRLGQTRAAPDLVLPQGPARRRRRRRASSARADFEKLADARVSRASTRSSTAQTDNVFEIRQKTKDHPRLWATVTIEPCATTACRWSSTKWKEQEAESLKSPASSELKDPPDVDVGDGRRSQLARPADDLHVPARPRHAGSGADGGAYSFTDAYSLYYNDGMNQIRVVGEYKDDPRRRPRRSCEAGAARAISRRSRWRSWTSTRTPGDYFLIEILRGLASAFFAIVSVRTPFVELGLDALAVGHVGQREAAA